VLRSLNLGEADRIITFLSPTLGRHKAVARGSRKVPSSLGGKVDLFSHCRFQLARGRTLDIITQAEVVDSFPELRANLELLAAGLYLLELFHALVESGEGSGRLFGLLQGALGALQIYAVSPSAAQQPSPLPPAAAQQPSPFPPAAALPPSPFPSTVSAGPALGTPSSGLIDLLLRATEAKLLALLGYWPRLGRCVGCGSAAPAVRFSPLLGGRLCPACQGRDSRALEVDPQFFPLLQIMARGGWDEIIALELDPALRDQLRRALEGQLAASWPVKVKSKGFLDRVKSLAASNPIQSPFSH